MGSNKVHIVASLAVAYRTTANGNVYTEEALRKVAKETDPEKLGCVRLSFNEETNSLDGEFELGADVGDRVGGPGNPSSTSNLGSPASAKKFRLYRHVTTVIQELKEVEAPDLESARKKVATGDGVTLEQNNLSGDVEVFTEDELPTCDCRGLSHRFDCPHWVTPI